MSILMQYPRQVIVLKGTKTVCGLSGKVAGLSRRMIDQSTTREFERFCSYIGLAQQGDQWQIEQLEERGREAEKQIYAVQKGGQGITEYFQIFESQFSKQEIRDIRQGEPYQRSTIKKFVALVALFAGESYEIHPSTSKWPKPHEWPHTFIYRNSIVKYVYFFRWIQNGSPSTINEVKVRNDLIDMNFATYATFFDGLMTKDKKLEELYMKSDDVLRNFLIPVMTHKQN
jgi:hypothetical protein